MLIKKEYFLFKLKIILIDKLKKNEINKVLEKTSKDISFLKIFKETVEKFNDKSKLGG